MKNISPMKVMEKIQQVSLPMGGVFTTADLFHLCGAKSALATMRLIAKLVDAGVLARCRRGIYVTKGFNQRNLAARLVPEGYVSLDSVLAQRRLVGTVAKGSLSVVARTPAKKIAVLGLNLRIHSISKDLFFGFHESAEGMAEADAEKAFLDLLYFHNRGCRFPFDPRSEVRIDKLDRTRLKRYLKKYRNPKFVAFVKGVINGR